MSDVLVHVIYTSIEHVMMLMSLVVQSYMVLMVVLVYMYS